MLLFLVGAFFFFCRLEIDLWAFAALRQAQLRLQTLIVLPFLFFFSPLYPHHRVYITSCALVCELA